MKIGITLTSSLVVGQEYIEITKLVAKILAEENFGIVYGGTDYGMMAELSKSYKDSNGKELIGIMSKELESVTKNYKAFSGLDSAIWKNQINERIRTMIDLSDGFIILPGGYGTLEEMMSIIGSKANKLNDKPIVILNHDGFYDNLLRFFDEMSEKQFSKIKIKDLVYICDTTDGIVNYFQNYSKTELPDKFV